MGKPTIAAQDSTSAADGGATSGPPSERSRGRAVDLLLFALIFAAALGLRIAYVVQLQDSPFFSHHELDARYHVEWAKAFAEGREREFIGGAYFRAPLYPWLLGTIYQVFGQGDLAPRIIQAVIGSLSCGLLFVLGRIVFCRTVGAIAGFAAAAYWVLIYFDGELMMESLYIFQLLLLLLVLVACGRRDSAWLWALGGVLLGLAAITRPNILLLGPAIVVWILLRTRPRWRRGVGLSLLTFAGCMAPIVPITIRNYVVAGDLVLIASQGGVNFYIGNNAQSDGVSARIPGDPGEWDEAMKAQTERAERALGRSLKGSEISRWYTGQALRWMGEQPGAAAIHLLAKLRNFWTFWEIPNDHYIPFITRNYTPLIGVLPFSFTRPEPGFAIIGPLGALGLLVSLRRRGETFPLWGFLLVYMLSVVLFFVNARFRAPVLPVLILFAAFGAVWLVQQVFRLRWLPLAGGAVALAGMGMVVSRVPANVDLRIDHNMIQSTAATGQILFEQDRRDEALALLADAAAQSRASGMPLKPDHWITLGLLLLEQQAYVAAADCFQQAIRLKPDHEVGYQNLGVALAGQNRMSDAAAAFSQALRLRPDDPRSQANLGNALVQSGNVQEGVELLRSAVRSDPRLLSAAAAASEALLRRNRHVDAERVVSAMLEIAPNDLRLLVMMIQIRAASPVEELRDSAQAVELARKALQLSRGQDPVILHVSSLALFHAGRTRESRDLALRALELARERRNRPLVVQIQTLLTQLEFAADPNSP